MSTSEYPAGRLGGGGSRIAGPRWIEAVRSASTETWLVVGLVAVAAAIRIVTINNQSFWMDEALTAFEARSSFGGMLGTVLHIETTPPLYFFLIWAWAHVFGTGEIALRLISTLSGIALVPIAYLATKELVSRRAGVLAAAFVTVNPFLIWYSQEARAYMLLAALCGASFLWFARARQSPSRRNVGWWGVCSALALMTHFFAAFVVAPEALWLLWVARSRLVAAAVGVVGLTELAMLPFAVSDTSHGTWWIAAVPKPSRISSAILEWAVSILYRRTPVNVGLLAGAGVLALVVALLVLGGDRRTRAAAAVAGAIAGVVFLAPLALAFLGQDYFLSRNVIPAVVPLTVVLAAACAAPRTRWAGGAVAVAFLAVFAWAAIRVQTHQYLERPNWRAVAQALGPARTPRAVLAADGTTADALKIYLPRVAWAQPASRAVLINEIDVVGATKRLPLVATKRAAAQPLPDSRPHSRRGRRGSGLGAPVPNTKAPRGSTLVARFRVHNWIVARFALARPLHVTAGRLGELAPRFFRQTPRALLIFFQRPGR